MSKKMGFIFSSLLFVCSMQSAHLASASASASTLASGSAPDLASAEENGDRPYSNLTQGELYRAINWIRDVSNPRHTAPPNAWTQEGRVGDTLFIDGEVQDIQWSMLKHGEYKGVKRVVLNSYGGLVEGALELATVIREQGLDTVVPAGGVCMSACTLLFQAGVRRQAHRSALFLYHAPRSGRIGMSALDSQCKAQGSAYCLRSTTTRIHTRGTSSGSKILF